MEKLKAFKGGEDLLKMLEEVTDDYDPQVHNALRVLFQLMLDRHWEIVKPALEESVERLVEIAAWDEVADIAVEAKLEAGLSTFEIIEMFKKRVAQRCLDARIFMEEVATDQARALLPRR